MDFDDFARAFGVDPKMALANVRPKGRTLRFKDNTPDPFAETARPRIPAGGFTSGVSVTSPQTVVHVSHDAPTGVHKGRRVKGILEEVRRYLLRRVVTPPGLEEIFPTGESPVPDSVPCDGERIVRYATPGGGFPTFPHLPAKYSTTTQYLMRAIASLHTMWGATDTHIKCTVLAERIGKTLDRLKYDPREA